MNKAEMKTGLLAGRRLRQEEWSERDEIEALDELVAEGVATATPWTYRDGFQCKVRDVTRTATEGSDNG
jgi:hypothetical protein